MDCSKGDVKITDVETKPKRKMKTPSQLEILEKAYAVEAYPSESLREELSAKLDLSDRQLQMWFCHRRLKDRKPTSAKRQDKAIPLPELSISLQVDHGLSSFTNIDSRKIVDLRAIEFVEARLGEPLRDDGPTLGSSFDPLPPGSFGAPIVQRQKKQVGSPDEAKLYKPDDTKSVKGISNAFQEYQFLPEHSTVKTDSYERLTPSNYYDSPAERQHINMDLYFGSHPNNELENSFISSDQRVSNKEASIIERKRKIEESGMPGDVEYNEKRIRKELGKQDVLRRKMEEQVKKEMERHDRERLKEEERLLREKQREEERYQKEQQRELERKEKFLQKEYIRAEKIRQKEELRKEKEAVRVKTANNRAVVRKMVKESMELIEDERLELMELAASSRGLPSILSLDCETLENLELFRDMLIVFPLKNVRLKLPFSIKPWADSDENVGNLLMVWRFLITFADVLGLWPFTLDEFVQALHDYDSRLLNEIHIALLRSVLKDIEDIARIPSSGLGLNQNSAANHSGGHPQIVENAYAWGFDIRSWRQHLNLLTWPEILRQFAISAGFGPQLDKMNDEHASAYDDNEGNEDIISNLRTGASAANAVTIMQQPGFSNPRKSRHCLTPGTVKFAAFHILSLAGSKGLSILEVADRIQKSGLRDLTTSKTPEASITAALSRDVMLFERTAPSTYCVRTPYRKDPVDAEAILSLAKEKIQKFKNGFSQVVEEADAVDRDGDSESDVAEDPEVDNLDPESNLKNEVETSLVGSRNNGVIPDKLMETSLNDIQLNVLNEGEPWIQGLMVGEYSDLSVEERLNALVGIISVAIEGNTIRIVLEDRLEAANALKKQMWAEAQIDKRRVKEEYTTKMPHSSFMGNRTEQNLTQIPLIGDEKNNESPTNHSIQKEPLSDPQNINNLDNFATEGNMLTQDYSAVPSNLTSQQLGSIVEKSRVQKKSYVGQKAEEVFVYRSLPLGQDRRRNRYWQFITCASHSDPGCGRIFVELCDGFWRLIDSEEGFDALLTSLDTRGLRESHLHMMLQKIEMSFRETLRKKLMYATLEQNENSVKSEAFELGPLTDSNIDIDSPSSIVCVSSTDTSEPSSSFAIELARNEVEKSNAMNRYQDFFKWMWQECFNSPILGAMKCRNERRTRVLDICDNCHDVYSVEDNHCSLCHMTYDPFTSNFFEHLKHCREKIKVNSHWILHDSESLLPLRVNLLKTHLASIEACILPEALRGVWTEGHRKSWGMKLHASSSAKDVLQILTILENGIKRDFLSKGFETTSELLKSSNQTGNVLPWIPHTTAAVALRLIELDTSIFYTLTQKEGPQRDKGTAVFIKPPSRYVGWNEEQVRHGPQHIEEDIWGIPGSSVRGRGNHGRGRGRSSTNSQRRSDTNKNGRRLSQGLAWKGRSRRRGRGRGTFKPRFMPKQTLFDRSQVNSSMEDWNMHEMLRPDMGIPQNPSSEFLSDYEYDQAPPGYEFGCGFKDGDNLEEFEDMEDEVDGYINDGDFDEENVGDEDTVSSSEYRD